VHDPDAADEQADGSNHPAAHARILDKVRDVFSPIFLRAESEILDALVRRHQNILRLLQRWIERVEIANLHFNTRETRIARARNSGGISETFLRSAHAGARAKFDPHRIE